MTPLSEAQLHQIDEMRRLGGSDAQDRIGGQIALARLAGSGDAVRLALALRDQKGADPSLALDWASENGHADCLVLVINAMASSGTLSFPSRAAELAIEGGHTECFRLIIGLGADKAHLADALRHACAINRTACARILLDLPHGPEPDIGMSPTHHPGGIGAKSALDWCSASGPTASGSTSCERLLLEELCLRAPQRALPLCARHGHADLVESLLPRCDPHHAGSEALYEAAANGHPDCVKLLASASNPMDQDSCAMRFAAMNGHADCMALLIPLSNPAARGFQGLLEACSEGHASCAKLLLEAVLPDAQVATRCIKLAIRSLDADCVFEVFSRVGHLFQIDPSGIGHTPLHYAVLLNRPEYDEEDDDVFFEPLSEDVFLALLRAGARFESNHEGNDPLALAQEMPSDQVEHLCLRALHRHEAEQIGKVTLTASSQRQAPRI